MSESTIQREPCEECVPLSGHVIIAGYGIGGRAVAEMLDAHDLPYSVVELNVKTVDRVARNGVHIIAGNIHDERVLRLAGVERAAALAIALPNEADSLRTLEVARRLNPSI